MKKIISAILAATTLLTAFASFSVSADCLVSGTQDPKPYIVAEEIVDDELSGYVTDYELTLDGRALYRISIGVEGLDLTSGPSGTTKPKKKQLKGVVLSSCMFKCTLNQDVEFVDKESGIAVSINGGVIQPKATISTNNYPAKQDDEEYYLEKSSNKYLITEFLVLVSEDTTIAFDKSQTTITLQEYDEGDPINQQTWVMEDAVAPNMVFAAATGKDNVVMTVAAAPAEVPEQTVDLTATATKDAAVITGGDSNYYAFAKPDVDWDVDALDEYILKATAVQVGQDPAETKEWNLFSAETAAGAKNGFVDNDGLLESIIKGGEFTDIPAFYVVIKSAKNIAKVEIIKRAASN